MSNQNYNDGRLIRVTQVIPVRGGLYRQFWQKPVAASASYMVSDTASNSASVTTVSTFVATPDFARNITITPAGTTADVAAGTVSVTGTNIRGDAITENFTILANQSTTSTGSYAFATVTQVVIHAQDDDGATWSVGIGDKLGLEKLLQYNSIGGNAAVATGTTVSNFTREGTAPTVTVDTQSIHKNTVNFNTALAATKTYVVDMITDDPAKPQQDET